jgi:hypothetical protein
MEQEHSTAFFSYCREDSDFALKLAGDLKAAGPTSGWINWISVLDSYGIAQSQML